MELQPLDMVILGSDMNACELVGEYIDSVQSEWVEERYYFGRPFDKSDYIITRRWKLNIKLIENNVDDIPF